MVSDSYAPLIVITIVIAIVWIIKYLVPKIKARKKGP